LKDFAMSFIVSPPNPFSPRAPIALSMLALTFALAACGGGGADPVAASPAAQAPTPTAACAKTSTKIGQVATLSTRSHNVKGQAKIVDDCTIEISNFSYDGGGLSKVFVYGAKGGNYVAGFPIGTNLKGTVFSNQTLRVTLQAGDLDKLDGISIWCADANANFGDGTFAAM
jgi:Electron transfer DM13